MVDASVFAAIAFGEARSREAFESARGSHYLEPTILGLELAQVAVKKASARPKSGASILDKLEKTLGLPIHWSSPDPVSVAALALEYSLSAYDAAYLWLAKKYSLELVTFDKKLEKAAKRLNSGHRKT